MTAAGRQWKAETLPVADVQRHPTLQMRVAGVERGYAKKLQRVIEGGGSLPAIQVARIGKALYLVDGHHRLEAHRAAKLQTIAANVAKMSLSEAQDAARLANMTHGKRPSRADNQRAFEAFVAAGKHLEPWGAVKPCRAIAAELHYAYTHEAVRMKLKALKVQLDEDVEFPGGYTPFGDNEADLELERLEDARGHLEAFEGLFYSLPDDRQADMLATARTLVATLERGGRTERSRLDI